MRSIRQIRIAFLRAPARPATFPAHKYPGIAATASRYLHVSQPRANQQPAIPPTTPPKDVPIAEAATAIESTDILEVYRSLVARGLLDWDEEQVRCVMQVSPLPPTNGTNKIAHPNFRGLAVEETPRRTKRLHPSARPTRQVIPRRTAPRTGSTESGKRGSRRVVVERVDGDGERQGRAGADGEGEGVG